MGLFRDDESIIQIEYVSESQLVGGEPVGYVQVLPRI